MCVCVCESCVCVCVCERERVESEKIPKNSAASKAWVKGTCALICTGSIRSIRSICASTPAAMGSGRGADMLEAAAATHSAAEGMVMWAMWAMGAMGVMAG